MADPLRADDPGLADRARELLAAYVHIPFCRRVCPYCDFAVVAGREELADRYVAALVAEIDRTTALLGPPDSVAIGGGTPSRLGAPRLARIIRAIRASHGLAIDAEVSLEANPEDWSLPLAEALVEAGFTRVSLGAQSFDSSVLAALGREHAPEQAEAAVADARTAGFESVNLDLIYGTPGEDDASWQMSLRRALETGIDHLSCYALTVELGTPLSRAVAAGAAAPDPDDQADKYETAWRLAAAAGLDRYETSNAARPGHACRYNLITWAGGSYHGFGNGAHRHLEGERSWNVRRLDRYLEWIERGGEAVVGREQLSWWERERERLILGLRLVSGSAVSTVGERLMASPWGRRLIDAGVVVAEAGRLRVDRPLLGDEVARAVLALDPPDC